ncbi:arginine--tRNA ligase [Candidatus Gracilibacteria bacterium]|nr:arginine--tRNA ligase [Candidatus Gracilibacteria bacterium]
MENIILDYLLKNWNADQAGKIQFSAVPKGNSGDLAMNFFGLTKKSQQSPVQIAQELQKVLENCDILEKTEIAGPYLNLFFKEEVFFEKVFATPLQIELLKNKEIVVEFSGPNTNKPLHLGHMRNHAIGIALSNTLEKCGANVHRVNIINDRGIHICKSMLAYQKFGNGETPESTQKKGDQFVGDYYVKFETESKKNPSLNDEVQEMLVAWENEDPTIRTLWQKMNNWTLAGHQDTYNRQGVVFEKSYYESDTYKQGKKIAEEGLKKKVFEHRKDGTIVINFEDKNLGQKVILRADGTSIYLTNDLAVSEIRKKDFEPDEMIWVVADEQNYYFKVLFECLSRLGILDTNHLFHLGYGLVHLPDGRMKSREGNVIDADMLMNELHEIAAQKILKQNPNLPKQTIYDTAEKIQNAAWKFYLLKTSPNKSITFDKEKSIDFQGATGPYLQYAGVRIKSILEKSGKIINPKETNFISALSTTEKPLGIKILEFPKTLERAAIERNPTFIITYLLELSQSWSSFYAENSILKAKTDLLKKARLALANKVLETLESGLSCLGIDLPEKM